MAEPSSPRWYALDARSLAALRVGLAALVLLDLGLRSVDLVAHYTDAGVLPRALIPPGSWDFAWSLHRLGGSASFEAALFALHAAAAGALLLGWRTFWASLLTAALTISHLAASCPGLTMLVTSRTILHLAAEHEYPVQPLAVPTPGHLPEPEAL